MKYIKLILFSFFIVGCHKDDILPVVPVQKNIDIFSLKENTVSDGQQIMFKSDSVSTYIMKLVDKNTNQVVSKERIVTKIGENNLTIYTKSIQTKYLYLVMEDINKKEINKTTIIVK